MGDEDAGKIGSSCVVVVRVMYNWLYLADCYIGDEGAKHLSKGVWPNMSVIWLGMMWINLEKDCIVYDGWLAIAGSGWRTEVHLSASPVYLRR